MQILGSMLLLVLLVVGAAVPDASAEEKAVSLFDGKTLSGWKANEKMWRVEDGAIVGGTLKEPIPHNDFLRSEKKYSDFELTLKFKLLGEGVNSGVQIRTEEIPNHHEVRGYQADLGDGFWGAIYDESRRNRVLAAPKPEVVEKALRRGEWNDYKVRCEGPRIQIWLNDVQTVDYTEEDPSIPQEGIIAPQIHSGPPSEAWFKDIKLVDLSE